MRLGLFLGLGMQGGSGDDGPPIEEGDAALLEIGDFILLENGDKLLLE